MVIVGSKGSIRVIALHSNGKGKKSFGIAHTYWMAHIQSITSVNYASEVQVVMTGSVDCSVRLWTLNGDYIGSLGQLNPWLMSDMNSFSELPMDILIFYENLKRKIERKKKKTLQFHKNPEDILRGIYFSFTMFDIILEKEDRKLKVLRSVVDKWKGTSFIPYYF